MKKILFVFALLTLVSTTSCNKNKCWVISDCLGNDLENYCGSEDDIQSYCASHSTAGCNWTYRKQ
ncbi:MAG: hypothetical protein IPO01_13535 [Chitinophagaceae bacterium]|nr:hypothetical protein [Chitinophagaceae bacterium]